MNDQESLEEQLRGLAQELNTRPSLAPRVMGRIRDQVAGPESAVVASRFPRWIARPVPRYAGALGMVAALIVVALILATSTNLGSRLAFADVQRAMQQVKTAILVFDYPKRPHQNHMLFLTRDSHLTREEWPNGYATIRDGREGKVLALNPKSKTAVVMPGPLDASSWSELFDNLVHIEEDAVDPLGERTVDGRKLVGFRLKPAKYQRSDMRRHVWVDPQTRLPVRIDYFPVEPDHPQTAQFYRITRLTFNQPLDESMFRMFPPEGYQLSETAPLEMPLPAAPKDKDRASPILQPKVGIGAARFGMNLEQVIEALGEPDRISEYWSISPERMRAIEQVHREVEEKNLDRFEENRLLIEVNESFGEKTRTPDGMSLWYMGRGFELTVAKDQGLKGIKCYASYPGARKFTGNTSKGIGMGATLEEIEMAYGPPDVKAGYPEPGYEKGQFLLRYKSLGITFQGMDGRLWYFSATK